jgi:hypothetical protein
LITFSRSYKAELAIVNRKDIITNEKQINIYKKKSKEEKNYEKENLSLMIFQLHNITVKKIYFFNLANLLKSI